MFSGDFCGCPEGYHCQVDPNNGNLPACFDNTTASHCPRADASVVQPTSLDLSTVAGSLFSGSLVFQDPSSGTILRSLAAGPLNRYIANEIKFTDIEIDMTDSTGARVTVSVSG